MRTNVLNRRNFFQKSAVLAGGLTFAPDLISRSLARPRTSSVSGGAAPMLASDLPKGSSPAPLSFPHFPDRLHAFVWRNWQLPNDQLVRVVGQRQQTFSASVGPYHLAQERIHVGWLDAKTISGMSESIN
jgi:hypothetical protein